MARIRSIHPGLFTDESFMALSMAARQLLLGVWTEADDDGVFDWKPLTLKARIFPVDQVDVQALLEELVAHEWVRPFEQPGKYLGACRNFRRFQRPKKPTSRELLPPSLRAYVGLSDDSSPPVPHQFPTSGEKSPQMEDGGGRGEEDGEEGKMESAPQAAAPPAKPVAIPTTDLPAFLDRSKRGTRLPENWQPSEADFQFAWEILGSQGTVNETERFRDYWHAKAGKDATKLDWSATWRNWVRKAKEYGAKSSGKGQSGNGFASLAAARILGQGGA